MTKAAIRSAQLAEEHRSNVENEALTRRGQNIQAISSVLGAGISAAGRVASSGIAKLGDLSKLSSKDRQSLLGYAKQKREGVHLDKEHFARLIDLLTKTGGSLK